ncbi:helix-turn-helix domain-containing protein [Streptomyces sp. NPDC050485]|uniref:helix-turn-helix domain-containing protein n=1 Tax=Streptomyces sp. NPDC050485 TaxID=3365617 RepID=UPI0037A88F1B
MIIAICLIGTKMRADRPPARHSRIEIRDARTRRLLATELRRMYENGATLRELAQATGHSAKSVRDLLVEAGTRLRPRGRRPARPDAGPDRTAAPQHPHQAPDSRHRGARELRALYEQGASIRELSARTGTSFGAVRNRLLDAGTTLRSVGGFHRQPDGTRKPTPTPWRAAPDPLRDPETR